MIWFSRKKLGSVIVLLRSSGTGYPWGYCVLLKISDHTGDQVSPAIPGLGLEKGCPD